MSSILSRINRVLHLRKLARDKNSNANERASALRHARAMMLKHGITEKDVTMAERQFVADSGEEVTVLFEGVESDKLWRQALCEGVVRIAYRMVPFHEDKGRRRIYMVGTPELRAGCAADVQTLSKSMQADIPRWVKDWQRELFLEWCAVGFATRLKALMADAARDRGLMVHVPQPPKTPGVADAVSSSAMGQTGPAPTQIVVQSWATKIEPVPAKTSVRIGPPPDPGVMMAGETRGKAIAETYFEIRFDSSLALRLPK